MAIVTTVSKEELLQRVHDIEPVIRAHADEAEHNRRLSPEVAEAIRDAGFYRMFRPESRGGLGVDPVTFFTVMEELARIDSAAAWNAGIANASEPFAAWLSDDVTAELFESSDVVMAGSFNPMRKAVRVEGGFRVSGRTWFNSNCDNATWMIGLAHEHDGDTPCFNEDGSPVSRVTFFPASDAQIVDNWNTMGMRGTGSHDVVLEDVFVPEELAPLHVPIETPDSAYDTPFHRISTWAGVACNGLPSLGIARAAIDDLVAAAEKIPAYTENSLRTRNSVQLKLAQATAKLDSARLLLHSTFDEAWQKVVTGQSLDMVDKARCQMAVSHAVASCAEVVRLVHACVGASGIREEQRFQRYFRDMHVITQHAFACETRLEAVGQIMLGLEPDWPFFAF